MPKIPVYTAGQLASERTPIPTLDKSGQLVTSAITDVATKAYSVIEDVVQKQKALLQQVETAKLSSEYDSELRVAAAEIRKNNLLTPDEAAKQLADKQSELMSTYKERIKDPDIALRFDALGTQANYEEQTRTKLWAFDENNKLIQKNLFDRGNADIAQAAQTDSLDEVLNLAWKMDKDRKLYYEGWGGATEGARVVDTLQEGAMQAYFTNQISKGNAWKVLKELEDGRLGPAEYTWEGGERQRSNGFVPPTKIVQWKKEATAALMKGKNDAATLALISTITQNFDIEKEINAPLATTAEKINELTFEIGKQKELEKEGQVSPEYVAALEKRQEHLQKVYEFQLAKSDAMITPNADIEAEVGAAFAGLFKKGVVKNGFQATLEQIYGFQKKLDDSRGQIDPKSYDKWNAILKTAFQGEINGFQKSRFGTRQEYELGPIKFGDIVSKDKTALSGSKMVQDVLTDMMKKYGEKDKPGHIYDSLMFFIDELDERNALKDDSVLDALKREGIEGLMAVADRKATLKGMGLPYHINVDDVITRGGRRWRVKGFRDGDVDVELDTRK